MKAFNTILVVLMAVSALSQTTLPNQQVQFEKALALEEVQGKLQDAIVLYQKIIDESGNQALAAQAQLRIGLCYEKLGQEKVKQAQEAFQKVLDTYPDQTEVVQVARERIGILLQAQAAAAGDDQMELRRVLSITGPHEYHQVSPDGRHVAYFDYEKMSLVVRELATGKTRILKSKIDENEGEGETWFFRWSPDGKSIVCNWWRYEPIFEWADLRLLFVDGSAPRRILQGDYEEVYPYSWSSDAHRILSIFCTKDDAPRRMGIISTEDSSVHFLKTPVPGPLGNSRNYEFSPDGRYIAYDSPPDADPDNLNRDIYLVSIDGETKVPLITHPAHDAFLGWSPDGTRVLFTSDRLGTRDLWVVEVGNGTPVTDPEVIKRGIGQIESAGIIQSGSLYFKTSNAMMDIYLVGIDQETGKIVTPQRRMVLPEQGKNYEPQYSPDGKFFAYVQGSTAGADHKKNLCVRSLETKEGRCFPVAVDARSPRWSPDGRYVYFSGFLSGRQMRMFRMDRETGKYNAVTPDKSSDVTYFDRFIGCSKDGKSFYYIRSDESKPLCQIIARDAKGIDRQLYSAPTGLPWTAALSPDGSRIVAVSRALHREMMVLPTSGNEVSKVIYRFDEGGEARTWLAWAPDGQSILFNRRDNGSSLWRISVEGGEPQDLGIRTGGIRGISMHPDGKQLSFTALVPGTGSGELWALEDFLPAQRRKE